MTSIIVIILRGRFIVVCSFYEMKEFINIGLLSVMLLLLTFTATIGDAALMQFQSKLAPKMCAAGKSAATNAEGSSPLHLELCEKRSEFYIFDELYYIYEKTY